MNINDIDFNADDARKIVNDHKIKKEFVHHKFHAAIIKKIKQRATLGLTNTKYTLPGYLLGERLFKPENVLKWLYLRLTEDKFKVHIDYYTRTLNICWSFPSQENITSVKPKRKPVINKNKLIQQEKSSLFQYY